jgi:8-oxo-dGTP pyrophosphatase MutT (NUDIX family)
MTATPETPARPAATLLLLRDEPVFQVLMVRRHHEIDFASGALVFPGGKVEPEDAAFPAHLTAGADAFPADDRAARVAALRETFEESGVLIGVDPDGAPGLPGAAQDAARAALAQGAGFAETLEALKLRLDLARLTPFARWTPPPMVPKRYDTRFYLVAAPADQIAACDGCETVDAEWIAPSEALRLGETGERTIIFPTRMNLKRLAESGDCASALSAAAARPQVLVQPTVVVRDGRRLLTLPEEAGYGAVEEPFDVR